MNVQATEIASAISCAGDDTGITSCFIPPEAAEALSSVSVDSIGIDDLPELDSIRRQTRCCIESARVSSGSTSLTERFSGQLMCNGTNNSCCSEDAECQTVEHSFENQTVSVGFCCIPTGKSCRSNAECCNETEVCTNNVCGAAPPAADESVSCGSEEQACCSESERVIARLPAGGDGCRAGQACNESNVCEPCGAIGQRCCAGASSNETSASSEATSSEESPCGEEAECGSDGRCQEKPPETPALQPSPADPTEANGSPATRPIPTVEPAASLGTQLAPCAEQTTPLECVRKHACGWCDRRSEGEPSLCLAGGRAGAKDKSCTRPSWKFEPRDIATNSTETPTTNAEEEEGEAAADPCASLSGCASCILQAGCGWCAEAQGTAGGVGRCVSGTGAGPNETIVGCAITTPATFCSPENDEWMWTLYECDLNGGRAAPLMSLPEGGTS